MMECHNCNLNISPYAPQDIWDKLKQVYVEMPYWDGFFDGCPRWSGQDGMQIEASAEPGGLAFYAEFPEKDWEDWIALFKHRASTLLGYAVGEPEDGFDFPPIIEE